MDDHSVSVKALRCLELYSGIGGMHCALEGSLLPFDIVAAADINPVANSVYQHNFPNTRLLTKCLTTLTVGELDSYKADMILMSPPCQPFTRVGKRRDIGDERTQSFLHLLQLLPMLNKKPDYILVENVQGFEQSVARDKLVDVLNELDYSFQELMLSPVQFGIPNSRLRYYLIAKRKPLEFHQCVCSKICCTQLSNSSSFECLECTNSLPPVTNCSSSRLQACCDNGPAVCCAEQSELSNLMENDENDGYLDKFLVPRKLFKYFWVMDLVSKLSKNSCCFTKRYGRLIEGSGSVVQMSSSNGSDLSEFRDIEVMRKREEQFNDEVAMLRLRFFTPREIANILCFPKHFDFPESLSTLQLYRVLGNSINVKVVTLLLRLLTLGDLADLSVTHRTN